MCACCVIKFTISFINIVHMLTLYDQNDIGLPVVIAMSHNQTIEIMQSARFFVTVKGVGPFNYQWKRGIHNLKDQVNSTFVINNVSAKDQNYYRCHVTNNYGDSVLSNRIFLQVTSEYMSNVNVAT